MAIGFTRPRGGMAFNPTPPQALAPQPAQMPHALGSNMMQAQQPAQPKFGLADALQQFVLNYGAAQGNPLAQMTLQQRAQQQAFGQQQQEWDRRQQVEQQARMAELEWRQRNTPQGQPDIADRVGYLNQLEAGLGTTYARNYANNGGGAPMVVNTPQGTFAIPRSSVGQSGASAGVPDQAVAHLRQNPSLAAAFDQKYGAGASQRYLGGAPSQGGATFR